MRNARRCRGGRYAGGGGCLGLVAVACVDHAVAVGVGELVERRARLVGPLGADRLGLGGRGRTGNRGRRAGRRG